MHCSALGKQFTHNSTISLEEQPFGVNDMIFFHQHSSTPKDLIRIEVQLPNCNQKEIGDSSFDEMTFSTSHKVTQTRFVPFFCQGADACSLLQFRISHGPTGSDGSIGQKPHTLNFDIDTTRFKCTNDSSIHHLGSTCTTATTATAYYMAPVLHADVS